MDVYEFAMKMEKDGEKYYRDLAAGCSHKGLRSILGLLADAEVSHYEALKRMKDKEAAALPQSTVLDGAKTIFEQMASQGKDSVKGLGELLAVYAVVAEVDEYQMVVSTVADELETVFHQFLGKPLCVSCYLQGIGLELGRIGLSKSDSDGRNGMHVWPALKTGEYCLVYGVRVFSLAQ